MKGKYSVHILEKDLYMVCLYTSVGYGRHVDTPDSILDSTKSSVGSFLETNKECKLHMPKINSGLFRVPWYKTELIIEDLLNTYMSKGHNITVWEQ